MFQVSAYDLHTYFSFDPERKPELKSLDTLIRQAAPSLKCYFHQGTPAGEAGMRMKMIGYGKFRYSIKSGKSTDWPVVGVALQKNYISVYFSVTVDDRPIVELFKGKLGEKQTGRNSFSFAKFDDLKRAAVAKLFETAAEIFDTDPTNAVHYREGP